MHPNAQTLQRFYTAFSQLDHATMAVCYAPNATFDDEAFSLKGRDEVGGMWRMLCTASQKPEARPHWKLAFSGIEADAQGGRAHWEADYLFGATKRTVLNVKDQRANVVNLSLGVPGWTFHPEWRTVFRTSGVDSVKGHTLYVIAAGNDGVTQTANVEMNGALDSTFLVVGSVDPEGKISSFSNRPGTACVAEPTVC